jgi:hypothetical protein
VATVLVPDEQLVCATTGLLGVDGPPSRHYFFLVCGKGVSDEGNICIAEKELGEAEILQPGKEGLMHIEGKAVTGVPYKGGGRLGGIGRVKIDEIISAHAQKRSLNILAGKLYALDEVGDAQEFCLSIDGGVCIVAKGDVEAVGPFPIEASKAGLIEKEEHGGGGDVASLLALQCVESPTSPVVEGLFGGCPFLGGLWCPMHHLPGTAAIGVDQPL